MRQFDQVDLISGASSSNLSDDKLDLLLQTLREGGLPEPNLTRQNFIIQQQYGDTSGGVDSSSSNSNGGSDKDHGVKRNAGRGQGDGPSSTLLN